MRIESNIGLIIMLCDKNQHLLVSLSELMWTEMENPISSVTVRSEICIQTQLAWKIPTWPSYSATINARCKSLETNLTYHVLYFDFTIL